MTNKKELYSVRARGECGNEDLASNQAAGSVMDAENTVYTTTCSVMFVQNAINYISQTRGKDYETTVYVYNVLVLGLTYLIPFVQLKNQDSMMVNMFCYLAARISVIYF